MYTQAVEPAPVAEPERIRALDALRGIALLGILMVNMAAFKGLSALELFPRPESLRTVADQIAFWVIQSFFFIKFYPIFALLFGLGFALQIERLTARGAEATRVMWRRLLVLLLFGLIHGLFIWAGDVLLLYALCGMVLLALRGLRPQSALIAVAAIWGLQFLCCFSCGALTVWWALAGGEPATGQTSFLAAIESEARVAYAQPSYWVAQQFRFREWLWMLANAVFWLPNVLMMFLFGLYLGKVGAFAQLSEHRRLFGWLAVMGLLMGLVANASCGYGILQGIRTDNELLSYGWLMVLVVMGPVLAVGYVGAFAWLWQAWRGLERLLVPVAAAGRMALTNYLMQSVICTLLFYGYGLGLHGKVGVAQGIGLTVLIWLAQVVLSTLWLAYFQYGPMEWVWRSLTYGKRLPMRRPAVAGG
ncbi:MAG: DUF418 domain-containing protein [Fimbriimonadales bacterium]|nr:DUF418 domain-containing protein [Fimbriimonadales bacterium]